MPIKSGEYSINRYFIQIKLPDQGSFFSFKSKPKFNFIKILFNFIQNNITFVKIKVNETSHNLSEL